VRRGEEIRWSRCLRRLLLPLCADDEGVEHEPSSVFGSPFSKL
jgi:hypothetical protein